jgi:hypothetical protein
VSSRVLVLSGDPVGAAMAGPAIRAVELARSLTLAGHGVTLAVPQDRGLDLAEVGVVTADGEAALRGLVAEADVVVAFAPLVAEHPWLGEAGVVLVVDAYDPGLLETLERRRGEPVNAQRDWVGDALGHMVEPLRVADVVLVASDRQRHLVIGVLAALGRVGPRVVAEDPALDHLVRVVPFGAPATPPEGSGRRPLTGPGGLVAPGSVVALWGGGLYDWLDPVTLVEAVARTRRPEVVAVFLAGRHPTPAVGHAALVDVARSRAERLGLSGDRVVFHEEWVPYAERADWLLDAAVGVSLHHRHLETEFAFRTRVLDYLWAGLPVVCTEGDRLAELVASRALGAVVRPGDPDGVAAALDDLADAPLEQRSARRLRAEATAREMAWGHVTAPLVELCDEPRRAPDRRVAEAAPGPVGTVADLLRRVAGAGRGRW